MPTLTRAERLLRSILVGAARSDVDPGTLTYTQLGQQAAQRPEWDFTSPMTVAPFRGMGRALAHICTYEHGLGRPMITALVVRQETQRPGEGFAQLARELGRLGVGDDAELFWSEELLSVRAFWKDDDPSRILDAGLNKLFDELRAIRRSL